MEKEGPRETCHFPSLNLQCRNLSLAQVKMLNASGQLSV